MINVKLEPTPEASREARDILRSQLADRLSDPFLYDLVTVVTELVNNAVDHGPGEPIQVRVTVSDDGTVRGEVEDQGTGEVAMRELIDGGAGGGLGLRIVDLITDRWAVYEGSTHVWFEMRAADAP